MVLPLGVRDRKFGGVDGGDRGFSSGHDIQLTSPDGSGQQERATCVRRTQDGRYKKSQLKINIDPALERGSAGAESSQP